MFFSILAMFAEKRVIGPRNSPRFGKGLAQHVSKESNARRQRFGEMTH